MQENNTTIFDFGLVPYESDVLIGDFENNTVLNEYIEEKKDQEKRREMNPEEVLQELFYPDTITYHHQEFDVGVDLCAFGDLETHDQQICDAASILEDIIVSPELSESGCTGLSQFDFENYIDLTAFGVGEILKHTENTALEYLTENIISNKKDIPCKFDVTILDETDDVLLAQSSTEQALLQATDSDVSSNNGDYWNGDRTTVVANTDDNMSLDPGILTHLQTFEKAVATNNTAKISTKKVKVWDEKVTARRIKNNRASKICRATRKAKNKDLFTQEKKLIVENKKLNEKVQELTQSVELYKSHLIAKLTNII